MKRLLCGMLALVMIMTALPIVSAQTLENTLQLPERHVCTGDCAREAQEAQCITLPDYEPQAISIFAATRAVSLDAGEVILQNALAYNTGMIDLSSYGLTKADLKAVMQDCMYSYAQLFHVDSSYDVYLQSAGSEQVSGVGLRYTMSEAAYTAAAEVFEEKTTEIIEQVDEDWSELQKVLFVHDYLASNFAYDMSFYDQDAPLIYDVYGFLTQGEGVCQAYTLLFTYLMQQLNMQVSYVQSTGMNHIWNMVQVNSRWYQLDVTYDDPISDHLGAAWHDYFLLSDKKMKEKRQDNGESTSDWVYGEAVSMTSTLYDSGWFWTDATSPVVFTEDSEGYYVNSKALCRWDGLSRTGTTVKNHCGVVLGAGLEWYNGLLYYNDAAYIYQCDIERNKYEILLDLSESFNPYYIGGLQIDEDGMLWYDFHIDQSYVHEVIALKQLEKPVEPDPVCTCEEACDSASPNAQCEVCATDVTGCIGVHKHKEVTIPAVEATCTDTGLTAGVKCDLCGEILAAQEVVPSKGHTAAAAVKENEIAPTYTTAGSYDEVIYCSDCNAELSRSTVTVPVLTPAEPAGVITDTGRSLSLEGVIFINQYVKVSGFEGVDIEKNGGMLIWTEAVTEAEATIESTTAINVEGLIATGSEYMAQTPGIAAKEYADELYLRVFIRDNEGNYVYGPVKEYSVQTYANNQLKNEKKAASLKNLCAAMMHYGAAAQVYFGYNTGDLTNAGETMASWPADPWDAKLLTDLNPINTTIQGTGDVRDNGKSLSLEGAIIVNFYFKSAATYTMDTAELLVWNGVNGTLTEDNVSYVAELKDLGSEYMARTQGIAAKEYGKTIYACAKITDTSGEVHYSDVVAYSPEFYAKNQITKNTKPNLVALVKAMVTYGEYAIQYFAK